MTGKNDASKLLPKLTQELTEQRREAVARIAQKLVSSSQMEMAAIEEYVASQLPDIEETARQVVADSTLSLIVQEALLMPLARSLLAGLIDDCIRKTLAQTHFAETLCENLQESIERSVVPASLTQQIKTTSLEHELESMTAKYLSEVTVDGKFIDHLEERIVALTSQPLVAQRLHRQIIELAAQCDFSNLLSQRLEAIVRKSDHAPLLNQQLKDLAGSADLAAFLNVEDSEANAHIEQLSQTLCRAVRNESLRHIPYDQFIDRTFGSLPDFSLEGDEPHYAELGEEVE